MKTTSKVKVPLTKWDLEKINGGDDVGSGSGTCDRCDHAIITSCCPSHYPPPPPPKD